MVFMIYSLCGLAILKIILDVVGGELYATYSVAIETLIYFIVLYMIVRTYLKQREGRRETLQRKINELNQMLNSGR